MKVVPRVHGGSQVVGVELGMAVRCWGRVWRGGNDSVEVGVGVGLCVGLRRGYMYMYFMSVAVGVSVAVAMGVAVAVAVREGWGWGWGGGGVMMVGYVRGSCSVSLSLGFIRG